MIQVFYFMVYFEYNFSSSSDDSDAAFIPADVYFSVVLSGAIIFLL